jgi:hypothetical protein
VTKRTVPNGKEVGPMGEEKERREIVLKSPEALENILWEDGYPVGTIAHTEDMKYCWVWNGNDWEEC